MDDEELKEHIYPYDHDLLDDDDSTASSDGAASKEGHQDVDGGMTRVDDEENFLAPAQDLLMRHLDPSSQSHTALADCGGPPLLLDEQYGDHVNVACSDFSQLQTGFMMPQQQKVATKATTSTSAKIEKVNNWDIDDPGIMSMLEPPPGGGPGYVPDATPTGTGSLIPSLHPFDDPSRMISAERKNLCTQAGDLQYLQGNLLSSLATLRHACQRFGGGVGLVASALEQEYANAEAALRRREIRILETLRRSRRRVSSMENFAEVDGGGGSVEHAGGAARTRTSQLHQHQRNYTKNNLSFSTGRIPGVVKHEQDHCDSSSSSSRKDTLPAPAPPDEITQHNGGRGWGLTSVASMSHVRLAPGTPDPLVDLGRSPTPEPLVHLEPPSRSPQAQPDPFLEEFRLAQITSDALYDLWSQFCEDIMNRVNPIHDNLSQVQASSIAKYWAKLIFREELDAEELWLPRGTAPLDFERAAAEIRDALAQRQAAAPREFQVEDLSLFSVGNPLVFEQTYHSSGIATASGARGGPFLQHVEDEGQEEQEVTTVSAATGSAVHLDTELIEAEVIGATGGGRRDELLIGGEHSQQCLALTPQSLLSAQDHHSYTGSGGSTSSSPSKQKNTSVAQRSPTGNFLGSVLAPTAYNVNLNVVNGSGGHLNNLTSASAEEGCAGNASSLVLTPVAATGNKSLSISGGLQCSTGTTHAPGSPLGSPSLNMERSTPSVKNNLRGGGGSHLAAAALLSAASGRSPTSSGDALRQHVLVEDEQLLVQQGRVEEEHLQSGSAVVQVVLEKSSGASGSGGNSSSTTSSHDLHLLGPGGVLIGDSPSSSSSQRLKKGTSFVFATTSSPACSRSSSSTTAGDRGPRLLQVGQKDFSVRRAENATHASTSEVAEERLAESLPIRNNNSDRETPHNVQRNRDNPGEPDSVDQQSSSISSAHDTTSYKKGHEMKSELQPLYNNNEHHPSTSTSTRNNNKVVIEQSSSTASSDPAATARKSTTHLVVLVHGLHGNPYDLRMTKNQIVVHFPDVYFLCAGSNEDNTEGDIGEMGIRLFEEIDAFVEDNCLGRVPERLSFVGHSMGGLIVRSALPLLRPKYGNSFYSYITFSTMHLGLSYHENRLVEAGVWVLKKWRQSRALQQLSMSDYSNDLRESFLYKLSLQPGLNLFRHVVFVSSWQDQYAPFDSARAEVSEETQKRDDAFAQVIHEMASNLLGRVAPERLMRLSVNFHISEQSLDTIIGRAAHIQFLENQTLMKMIIVNYPWLFD
ncbi:unnamed protein product [Amoebophrya sp. A25]|nr:unnamed protein product [Amoebophrya sp. A25]|eukprot:GSA25T00023505001.1